MHKPSENRSDCVKRNPHGGSPDLRSKRAERNVGFEEFWIAMQMQKYGDPRQRHQGCDEGVKQYCRFLIAKVTVAKRVCQNASREWNKRRRAQNAEIDPVQRPIQLLDLLKQVVMVLPDDAYVNECHQIGDVGWPFLQQLGGETTGRCVRSPDFEYEQGNDDGEGSVT